MLFQCLSDSVSMNGAQYKFLVWLTSSPPPVALGVLWATNRQSTTYDDDDDYKDGDDFDETPWSPSSK